MALNRSDKSRILRRYFPGMTRNSEMSTEPNTIAFFKVENDGFDLGAQRRPIDRNDLPRVQAELGEYLRRLRESRSLDDFQPVYGIVVEKAKIAGDGEYNLSGERYRENRVTQSSWPLVALGDPDVFQVESGGTPKSDVSEYWDGGVPWITLVDLPPGDFITEITDTARTISLDGLRNSSAKMIPANSIVVSSRATIGRIGINRIPLATNQGFKNVIIRDGNRAIPEYVALVLTGLVPAMDSLASGATYKEIIKSKFSQLEIPLPPLSVQQEIVAEIEGYQKVINGAWAVVENYRPHIVVDPEWPLVALGDVCDSILSGGTPSTKNEEYWNGDIPWITSADIVDIKTASPRKHITAEAIDHSATNLIPKGNIIVSTRVGLGKLFRNDFDVCISQDSQGLILKKGVNADYMVYSLGSVDISLLRVIPGK